MKTINRFWALLSELLIEKAEDAVPESSAQAESHGAALPPRIERAVPLADRFLFM
ncbi:hypothetical protein [Serratia entomophila]|uniref:hypothetical protein n=1 Tax=Serratia entomophila TaxID=42906 RepID=UPI00217B778D|nr:hypothetical protein [Serratia entomophila]CAI0781370.1 Uncharacterised protein [Serratia entomophila]CAI0798701.1 Uncharacterised protein [Serratia entomophila]CAI0799026.1 Uncharacterised protein [Serratia entomophila]CAI0799492.1 Uncharacterised protein [Serratia entomophila]CAI1551214.1 Uncharacterised protein [Serratia entomophila]